VSRYTVHHGYMHRLVSGFESFVDALACFLEHETERPCAPKLLGEGYDFDPERGETSGLTEEEESILEHVQAAA
jgi:hypothetical protein